MSQFAALNSALSVSPQLSEVDVQAAGNQGFTLIINNRPEGESDDQTSGADIAKAAANNGLEYIAIPVTPGGFTPDQVAAMRNALAEASGPALAYCRTGTRSTMLWALAQASMGENSKDIAASAAQAGYDISPIRKMMAVLEQRAPD